MISQDDVSIRVNDLTENKIPQPDNDDVDNLPRFTFWEFLLFWKFYVPNLRRVAIREGDSYLIPRMTFHFEHNLVMNDSLQWNTLDPLVRGYLERHRPPNAPQDKEYQRVDEITEYFYQPKSSLS